MKPEIRWCADIGMFAIDRPINPVGSYEGSCGNRTEYCDAHCYNNKLYRLYPAMRGKDIRNEAAWRGTTGADYRAALDRKKLPTDRLRLMTRGDALATPTDVDRVASICQSNPGRLIWCPTRAWRDSVMRRLVVERLFSVPNLALLASTDPTTTDAEWRDLAAEGWSTMFFGDDARADVKTPTGDRFFKCPKTHRDLKGHCADCKAGCFAPALLGRRVDVHLSEH